MGLSERHAWRRRRREALAPALTMKLRLARHEIRANSANHRRVERVAAMCLGPDAGGRFDLRKVPRRAPAPDEIEIAVEASSVNPIDVARAEGYGRTLLSLMVAKFRWSLATGIGS